MKKKVPLPTLTEELLLWQNGYDMVIGVDEVGRGSFAGPVVASACVLVAPGSCHAEFISASEKILKQVQNDGVIIHDSKQLTTQEREKTADWVQKNCFAYGIGEVGVPVINKIGIGKATEQAMRLAIAKLLNCYIAPSPSEGEGQGEGNNTAHANAGSRCVGTMQQFNNYFVLSDAFYIPYVKGIPRMQQKPIIKGDQKSLSIAAASIIAKVYRDNLMVKLDEKYPMYYFKNHKGYGTKAHQEAIRKHGLSKLHRTSFDLKRFL